MSNHLITEVYKRQIGSMARNAVMVLLADKASDDGTGIWASKQRMAEELGTSKQTVISTVKALIADGLLSEAGKRKCPNGYTVEYAISVEALKALPFVKCHQSSELTGEAASPVKEANPTSQAALPKPSRTKVLSNDKNTGARDLVSVDAPDWMPPEWTTYLQVRTDKHGAPSEQSQKVMIGKLDRWRAKGHDPTDVLNNAIEGEWKGLWEPKEAANDKRPSNTNSADLARRKLGLG